MEKIDGLETKLDILGEKLARLDLSAEPHSSSTLTSDPVDSSSSETQDLSSAAKPVIDIAEAGSASLPSLLPSPDKVLIESISSDSLTNVITSALRKLNSWFGMAFLLVFSCSFIRTTFLLEDSKRPEKKQGLLKESRNRSPVKY